MSSLAYRRHSGQASRAAYLLVHGRQEKSRLSPEEKLELWALAHPECWYWQQRADRAAEACSRLIYDDVWQAWLGSYPEGWLPSLTWLDLARRWEKVLAAVQDAGARELSIEELLAVFGQPSETKSGPEVPASEPLIVPHYGTVNPPAIVAQER